MNVPTVTLLLVLVGCGPAPASAIIVQIPPSASSTGDASPADGAAYSDEQQRQSTSEKVAAGKQVYERDYCVTCHSVDGTPKVGPSFVGIWGTTVILSDGSIRIVDEPYIRESILTPYAFGRGEYPMVMPVYKDHLEPSQLDALVAYIESLRTKK